jgi:hypothetical protein
VKCSATATFRRDRFMLHALVRRAKWRLAMPIMRFCRSTKNVPICLGSGLPSRTFGYNLPGWAGGPMRKNNPLRAKSAPKNVDEYLARVAQPARGTLEKIRAAIRSAVPAETTETIRRVAHPLGRSIGHSLPRVPYPFAVFAKGWAGGNSVWRLASQPRPRAAG